MDSTLLGALIGGGFALSGAIVTVIATYYISTKQERKKLLSQKKEDTYNAVEILKGEITNRWTRFHCHESIIDESQIEKPSPIANLNMILSIYFNELSDDRNKMNELYNEFNLCFMKIYSLDSVTNQRVEFKDEFLKETHLKYRSFIQHINGIQKTVINISP